MKIQVTAEDIEKGVPEDGAHCMVARAVKRETGLDHIEVGAVSVSRHVAHGPFDEFYHARLPLHVTEAIEAYDAGRPVEPFEFDLDVSKLTDPAVSA